MDRGIPEYLAQLRVELAESDPATIQDALSDAEEHLSTALANALKAAPDLARSDLLESIVKKYGTPAEIAAAYKDIEAHTRPVLEIARSGVRRSRTSSFYGVVGDARAWGSLMYLLVSMLLGLAYFSWAVIGFSLSLELLILVIGLPVATLFLQSVRGIGLVEGRIVEALLGVRMPRQPLVSHRELGWWKRLKMLVKDKRTWTTLAYMVLLLPLGILYFTIAILMFALSLEFIAGPIVLNALDLPFIMIGHYSIYLSLEWAPLLMFAGILILMVSMHVAKFLGRMHARLARAMLIRR
ncbi:MAG TPA: sensor domain-containing protein [Acidobacteriota bacterium]|nr:sensor domain-containing protein [Acidobacteriota bacterium]